MFQNKIGIKNFYNLKINKILKKKIKVKLIHNLNTKIVSSFSKSYKYSFYQKELNFFKKFQKL